LTKKDGDKLREMKTELSRMALDYRPLGVYSGNPKESDSMGQLALGIERLLEGYTVKIQSGKLLFGDDV
jgi:hypothetical protein